MRTITGAKAKEMIDNNKDIIILDVREKEEFESGHIKNAINIPLDDIEDVTDEILNPECDILVYCRSGIRSISAVRILEELGYDNVLDFGGILTWEYGLE